MLFTNKNKKETLVAKSVLDNAIEKGESKPDISTVIFPFIYKENGGILSFYFNKKLADKMVFEKNIGNYLYDDATENINPYFICSTSYIDNDYNNGKHELFKIGNLIENDKYINHYTISRGIIIPQCGVINFKKKKMDSLNDGDLCFVIDTNITANGNNPNKSPYYKYAYIEDKIFGIDTVQYLVPQYSYVHKGDKVLYIKSNYMHLKPNIIKTEKDGYIYFDIEECNLSSKLHTNIIEQGDRLFTIWDEKEKINKLKEIDTTVKTIIEQKTCSNEEKIPTNFNEQKIVNYRIYQNKKYIEYCYGVYVSEEKVENKESILSWICESGECNRHGVRLYIKSDATIDAEIDSTIHMSKNETPRITVVPVNEKLPNYVKFDVVNCNFYLMSYGWNSIRYKKSGYKNGMTEKHKITTLKGCPNIVHGTFKCEDIEIENLIDGPIYVDGDFIAKSNKISSFVGMPKYIGGCFNIANNEFDDAAWEYAKENIDSEFYDYNIANNKFVKYRKELC